MEEIDEEELWKISSEQLAYYKGQFKGLQPDPSGLVGGAQAKQFFEKSRLPNEELSRIWCERAFFPFKTKSLSILMMIKTSS